MVVPIGYKLVFEDHFDTVINTNEWNKIDYSTSPWVACVSAENSYTENGNYVARIDNVACPGDPTHNARCGGIKTKQSWLYGYFEARMKLAPGTGIANAFWLCRTDYVWPPEIDICETSGNEDTPYLIHYSLHYDVDNKTKSGYYTGPDYSLDYHIFGCEWTPTDVKFYVDGILKGILPLQESMKVPMGIRLTLYPAIWDINKWPPVDILPIYMYVDYVRAYQKVSTQGICTATSKTVGQVVTQRAAPTGQGPFTVIFKKDGVQIGTTQTVAAGGAATNNYTTVAGDVSTIPHIFSVETTGSCVGSVPCVESCPIMIMEATVCSWITIKGGPTGITVPNIFELVDAYIGIINISFFLTVPEIMGCVDYYLGFISSGNMKTGCVF